LAALLTENTSKQLTTTPYNAFQKSLWESESDLLAHQLDHFILRYQDPRFNLKGVELVASQMVVRTPYCDNDLVEYILSIPVGLRQHKYITQKLIVDNYPAYAKIPNANTGYPLMPTMRELQIRISQQLRWWLRNKGLRIISPRQKREYADYNGWIRTVLREWTEDILLSPLALERGYFQEKTVRKILTEHMAGSNHARKLGILLALELWHRQFLD
jgi:hypothetical protein